MFLWGRSWGDEQDEPSQTGFQALVRFSSYPEGVGYRFEFFSIGSLTTSN